MPSHIEHAIALKKIFDLVVGLDHKVDEHTENLRQNIFEAIDAKVEAEGGVNSATMKKSLDELKDELFRRMDALSQSGGMPSSNEALPVPVVESDVQVAGPFSFHYKGTSWCIPESFAFPQNTTRLAGWKKWLRGSVHVDGGQRWKIKPFRQFVSRDFPNRRLRITFSNEWKTIFGKMMETPGLVIPTHEHNIDDAFVENSYAGATEFLRENYSYIFEGPEGSSEGLLIGTWSKKIRRSMVLKHGTSEDISKLAPAVRCRPKSGLQRLPGARRKRRKVPGRGRNSEAMIEDVGDGDEGGYGSEAAPVVA